MRVTISCEDRKMTDFLLGLFLEGLGDIAYAGVSLGPLMGSVPDGTFSGGDPPEWIEQV